MNESISVRAYRPVVQTHHHNFHQVVVPLHGVISIHLNDMREVLPVGHCVVIKKNVEHSFSAEKESRFLVVDLCDLPDSANSLINPFVAVPVAFRSFCLFAEAQLKAQLDEELEQSMIYVFKNLLMTQKFQPEMDKRIIRALRQIESDISKDIKLRDLADVSSLSVSQFKVLFAKHTGKSLREYLLMVRMERARALLVNTDMPLSIVAEASGYKDQSAFSRRFRNYFGIPPRHCKRRYLPAR